MAAAAAYARQRSPGGGGGRRPSQSRVRLSDNALDRLTSMSSKDNLRISSNENFGQQPSHDAGVAPMPNRLDQSTGKDALLLHDQGPSPERHPERKVSQKIHVVAPGDEFWAFVEDDRFQLAGGAIILFNLFLFYLEAKYPDLQDIWIVIENILLIWYVFELGSRAARWRCVFFTHPVEYPWNLLDLVIVFTAVLDSWMLPLLQTDHHSSPILRKLRALRALRILRAIRLIRILATVDFSWTEKPWFQTLGAVVISFNAILLGLETDIESPLWWYFEQLLLVFFVFELAVRMKRFGLFFFSTDHPDIAWNWLDFIIVTSAVLDQWVRPLVVEESGQKSAFGKLMMLMRMLRLMRILRLLRLVKAVRPLYKLAIGMMAAMQSMFWVLVLTFLGIYAMAILTTRLIGHCLIVDDPDDLDMKTKMQFATINQSMFTLFEIMTSWSLGMINPLLDALPGWRPTFVGFTVFATWALLSVMAGIVSENIINASHNWNEREKEDNLDNRDNELADQWATLFRLFDTSSFQDQEPHVLEEQHDENEEGEADEKPPTHTLRLQHLELLMKIPSWMEAFRKQCQLPVEDLIELFNWLDVYKEGAVDTIDFVAGFICLIETMTNRSILKLIYDVHESEKSAKATANLEFKKVCKDFEGLHEYADRTTLGIEKAQKVWLEHIKNLLKPKFVVLEQQLSSQVRAMAERVENVEARMNSK